MSDPLAKKLRSQAKDEQQMQPESDEWKVSKHRKSQKKYDCQIMYRYVGPIESVFSQMFSRDWKRERKTYRKLADNIIKDLKRKEHNKYFEFKVEPL